MEPTTSTLCVNHILKGNAFTYHIEKVLGQGSFGITYLATTKTVLTGPLGNVETEVKVAIKEFFMKEFSSRHEDGTITEMTGGSLVQNYSKKFRKEAENLAKLSHPNIVNVLEVFDANNTCYYAMQYIPGGSLDEYVRKRGGLPEKQAIECIRQIGAAVQYMHDHKMLHLDLKPANVMRSEDGKKMVLIDFGLSKQYKASGNPESSTSVGLGTPGYAPLEQSNADRDKDFAPKLDVYALGATFFKLLTGKTPPIASDVNDEGIPILELKSKGVSTLSIRAIESSMEPRKSKRLPDVNSFLSLLSSSSDDSEDETEIGTPKPKPQPKPKPEPEPKPTPKPSFPLWLKWMLASAAAVILIVLGIRSFINPKHVNPDDMIIPADSVSVVDTHIVANPETRPSSPSVPAVVPLKSISLNKSALNLEEGQSATLSVKYTPSDATDKTTSWKSSDTKVVTVNASGKVNAVGTGMAVIIASCGGVDSFCNVTVTSQTASVQNSPASSSTSSSGSRSGVYTVGNVSFRMVQVEGGTFQMGATPEQGSDADSDESPVHSVTLSSYSIGETEVTQELWEAVMGSNPSNRKGSNLPVERVSWKECQEFISRLNAKTGASFRLPTEAEWEYAARGGRKSVGYKYSGSDNISEVAWCDDKSGSRTHPVKGKKANELGLYDMSGNVWEWCQDWYGSYSSYSSGSQTNPNGASSGSNRVVRGGGWFNDARICRVSDRYSNSPDNRGDLGLRLAL